MGAERSFKIEGDGEVTLGSFTTTQDGQGDPKSFSFTAVGKARLVRVVPLDTEPWRIYNITWIYTKYPERAITWETAPTDLGNCGWKHVPEMYVDLESNTVTTLTVTIDGAAQDPYYLPSTSGEMLRTYLRLAPTKGKIYQFRLTNAEGARVFDSSCVKVGDWGRSFEQAYRTVSPFGGPGGDTEGAVI